MMTPLEMLNADPDYRKEFLDTPIVHHFEIIPAGEFTLGLPKDREFGMVCGWWHRPYDQRDKAERADYDRLEQDIIRRGVRSPVIGWRFPGSELVHVVVGMRRTEIVQNLRNDSILPGWRHAELTCAVIEEDIRYWWKWDATVEDSRQARLVKELGQVDY